MKTVERISIILLLINVFFIEFICSRQSAATKYLSLNLLPKEFTMIVEILTSLIFLLILLNILNKNSIVYTKINSLLFVFVLIVIFVSLSLDYNKIILLSGIRSYFRAIILFFAVVYFKSLDNDFYKKLFKYIFYLGLIQLPIAIYQKFVLSPLYTGTPGDVVVGTFGASHLLSFFLISLLVVTFFLFEKKMISFYKFIVIISIFIFTISINETKITFFLMILFFLYFFSTNLARIKRSQISFNKKNVFMFTSIIVIFFILIALYSKYSVRRELYPKLFLSPKFLKEYYSYEYLPSGLSRTEAVRFAIKNISSDPFTALMGVGIGNASHSFFKNLEGKYYKRYPDYFIDRVFLSKLLWETGFIGLTIILLIFFRLYRLSHYISRKSEDKFHLVIAKSAKFIIIIALISFVYSDTMLRTQFAYPFWLLMGYLQRVYNQGEQAIKLQDQ